MKPISLTLTAVLAVALLVFSVAGIPTAVAPDPQVIQPVGELQVKAAPIAEALAGATLADRLVWAEIWEKSAKIAAAGTSEPVFADTKSMRAYTVVALDIGWRRLQGVTPGKYPRLKAAVEAFLADPSVLGRDEVAATDEDRRKYAEACKAIAWAGMRRG